MGRLATAIKIVAVVAAIIGLTILDALTGSHAGKFLSLHGAWMLLAFVAGVLCGHLSR